MQKASRGFWGSGKIWGDRVLSLWLAAVVIATIVYLGYVISDTDPTEKFTEFYVLNQNKKAYDYPVNIKLGDKVAVVLGVVNLEGGPNEYRIEITSNGEKLEEEGPFILPYKEKWEQQVSFQPAKPGQNQKIEFRLYKGAETQPYRNLHLFINVGDIQSNSG
ncbi:MAG: DUF1616 domain-containing protein [Dehalococcoidia bacterium]|nr:DUF1616 domain-containing protein [Dehalococcoidia bacterium]